jgi:hypothetical protein
MRDPEVVIEALRIASESLEDFDPVMAVDRALAGFQNLRRSHLRLDLLRLLVAYDVRVMDDLKRVYLAQKRAYDAQRAPAEREPKAGRKAG